MNLPADITQEILELAFGLDIPQARKARFVCFAWAVLLKPLVFRKLNLIFSVPRDEFNRATFHTLSTDASIASLVRCVEVLEWNESGLLPPSGPDIVRWMQDGSLDGSLPLPGSTTAQLKQLRALMPILHLTELCWRARPRMPEWFLLSLQQHSPNCSLKIALQSDHVAESIHKSKEPTIPAMESIPSLRLLKSMSTLKFLEVALAANEPRLFYELQNVIKGCPRLEHLQVYAIAETYGGIGRRSEVNAWPWKASAAASTFMCPQIKSLSLQNICVCHDGDNSWQQFTQWSLLRSVSFTCPSFFTRLDGRLENLVSLHFNLDNPRQSGNCLRRSTSEEIKMSLLRCQHLESLEMNNITAIVDDEMLKSMGASLKTLRLHADEYYFSRNIRHAITQSQICAISEHCPLLTELAIDIEHDLTWPVKTFDLIVAKLSYVKHIALNFELGGHVSWPCGDLRRLRVQFPQVTEKTARQIFHYIRRQSCSSGGLGRQLPSLGSIAVSCGSRDRPDKPFLGGRTGISKRPWVRFHTRSLHVESVIEDGPENGESVIMSCPELEVLLSASRELSIVPESLQEKIRHMAEGIVIGPHSKIGSVLDFPISSSDVTNR